MALRSFRFVVYDKPTPLARPRFARTKVGVRTYTVQKDQNARLHIRHAWYGQLELQSIDVSERLDGPIRLTVTAYVPMPKSIPKKKQATAMPVTRPDLDNYVKQVEDALLGYAYRDDAQIVTIVARKRYGEPPRWEITLDEIELVTD